MTTVKALATVVERFPNLEMVDVVGFLAELVERAEAARALEAKNTELKDYSVAHSARIEAETIESAIGALENRVKARAAVAAFEASR